MVMKSSPRSLQIEKACMQQRSSTTAKYIYVYVYTYMYNKS